ncbi:ABC transporter substrate-binding protein [Dongshaea marina]|uniref:ABC transporter substrate-binding protein n=1 Tax=Dongshaea marina TaxID=2047966 RepID=UPI001F2476DA|nr:ABC transporter substrate-binding protein [Dongshaea marina]
MLIPLFLFSCGAFAASVPDKPKVLVIESYHDGYPWDQDYKRGLEHVLADEVQFFNFQMDTKRVHKTRYVERANAAWAEYKKIKPDLVILGDDNALRYLGTRLIQSGTPTVFLGINNNPRNYIPIGYNITGILERPLIKRSIAELRRLVPGVERILLLFDSGVTSRIIANEVMEGESKVTILNTQVTVRYIGRWESWQTIVRHAKKHYDAIVIGLYHTLVDQQGQHVPAEEVIRWSSQHSPLPLFGLWGFAVGRERTVGGMVLSGYEQGIAAGVLAKKILNGMDPASVSPKVAEKGYYLFSRSQLQKWNIKLPDKIARKAKFVE